jgi:hypothetical protein
MSGFSWIARDAVLRGCLHRRALTTDDVQGTVGDVRVDVEALRIDFLLQSPHKDLALLREHFHETVQDTEVECWCDDLPMGVPLLTYRKSKLISTDLRFEVLTIMTMKTVVFSDVAPLGYY